MTMVVSRNGAKAKIVHPSAFEQERSLQQYIHVNPESIPVQELREDKKLLILKREFPTNSGPIDALAIDKDGEIYIVETKLYKNPDKRTVIAQALDYGAALWSGQLEFASFLKTVDEDIQGKFGLSFEDKVKECFELSDEATEVLKSLTETNLKDGNLKFIILMDSIDTRLKDLIVYVNQNSKFDIYGVQFKFYKLDDYEIIIPKLFGGEVKKNLTPRSSKIIWDENLFFKDLTTNVGSREANIVRSILNWYESKGIRIKWGAGAKIGTFFPTVELGGKQLCLFGVESNGKIIIVFQDFPFDHEMKCRMIEDINSIGDISIPERAAKTWKSFPLSCLEDKQLLEKFLKTFERYFPEISK